MKPRNYPDWLKAFTEYTKFGEAPKCMYFWAGVSAVAGALQRKVWLDMGYFSWYPNFYICFVAPPGVATKSTTMGSSMGLLRQVPGVRFGPDVVTMQALITDMADNQQTFEYQGLIHTCSTLTVAASEFGNLLDPKDRGMTDMLTHLWDGVSVLDKKTKGAGSDVVQNPWLNLLACTTPAWLEGNFPEYMIGGGLTSRFLFVYADKKQQYVAYPNLVGHASIREMEPKLIEDLIAINSLVGPFRLTNEAIAFGQDWYVDHHKNFFVHRPELNDERFGGYKARKQAHVHKLAMVLCAATASDMVISREHLELAVAMVTDLEPDMHHVFQRIGRGKHADVSERFLSYIGKHPQGLALEKAYAFIHASIPSEREFMDLLEGLVRSGKIRLSRHGAAVMVYPVEAK